MYQEACHLLEDVWNVVISSTYYIPRQSTNITWCACQFSIKVLNHAFISLQGLGPNFWHWTNNIKQVSFSNNFVDSRICILWNSGRFWILYNLKFRTLRKFECFGNFLKFGNSCTLKRHILQIFFFRIFFKLLKIYFPF